MYRVIALFVQQLSLAVSQQLIDILLPYFVTFSYCLF